VGREESYRVYAEQLFRHLESLGVTSFLITESEADPARLTRSGIEEFLADGVIVMYNLRKGDMREGAIEVLKMRGAKFQKKVVLMEIVDGSGIAVYPNQKVFGEF
jgi:circadian clock protein KaiC